MLNLRPRLFPIILSLFGLTASITQLLATFTIFSLFTTFVFGMLLLWLFTHREQ